MTIEMTAPCILHQVTENVWWYSPDGRTDRPSLGAVVGSSGTLLLDVGASPAHTAGFLRALEAKNLPPPRYAALTHWHWDHSFGGAALEVPIIAQRKTANQLSIQADYAWDDASLDERVANGREIDFCAAYIKKEMPDRSGFAVSIPDVIFDERLTINLGNLECEFVHVGGDHAADSVVAYIEEEGVLFTGDCLYPAIYSPVQHYTVENMRALLRRLRSFDAAHYILGHHEAVMQDEVHTWMRNLQVISDLVAQHSSDKNAVLAGYRQAVGTPPDEDTLEDIDYFLAGAAQ